MNTIITRRLSSSPRWLSLTLLGVALAAGVAVRAQTPQPANPQSSGPVKVDSATISGLGARNIGSAQMSGRIGAITVDPKNPKTVWVGTGEAWTRNSTSVGDGVYKSTDGGDNWTNVGLRDSERIAKILVDPTNTDTVYVCAPGKLWSDSDERGVYKTTDAGKTWTKVLKGANASTGCSMLSMDRQNPKTIYPGLWDFRRQGWIFRSGGDSPNVPSASGLFKSTDGGATWTELDASSAKGLPPKPWGRVAVSVAPSKPEVVYAFVEAVAPLNGLYRSDDGGKNWAALDRSQNMIWRTVYFAHLIRDPND